MNWTSFWYSQLKFTMMMMMTSSSSSSWTLTANISEWGPECTVKHKKCHTLHISSTAEGGTKATIRVTSYTLTLRTKKRTAQLHLSSTFMTRNLIQCHQRWKSLKKWSGQMDHHLSSKTYTCNGCTTVITVCEMPQEFHMEVLCHFIWQSCRRNRF